MSIQTMHRNMDLGEMVQALKNQQAVKNDVIVSADKLAVVREGRELPYLVVRNAEPQIDETGVTQVDGYYNLSDRFIATVATRLGVPGSFLKKTYLERGDVFTRIVNSLLHGSSDGAYNQFGKNSTVRLFSSTEGEFGLARCILSDSYKIMDNLDVVTSVLRGITDAGLDASQIHVGRGDISETRMRLDIDAPGIRAAAEALLDGYRDPRTGNTNNKIVHAGLRIQNSETGSGALSLTPFALVEVCSNGMTVPKMGSRQVHLGRKMDEGLIDFKADTHAANNHAVQLAVRDSVGTMLTPEFLDKVVSELTQVSDKKIDKPQQVIERISKKLQYTEDEQEGILSHFLLGGQATSGGVGQAITSYLQDVEDVDRAAHLSDSAFRAMELV